MNRLQKLRVDALMTPEQLSAATGVSHKTIRRLEAGEASPQMATLAKLSTYFGVPASELLLPATPGPVEPTGATA